MSSVSETRVKYKARGIQPICLYNEHPVSRKATKKKRKGRRRIKQKWSMPVIPNTAASRRYQGSEMSNSKDMSPNLLREGRLKKKEVKQEKRLKPVQNCCVAMNGSRVSPQTRTGRRRKKKKSKGKKMHKTRNAPITGRPWKSDNPLWKWMSSL